jgi:hypothetical protein
MPTIDRKLCGQFPADPSEVEDQSKARISAAISPFAENIAGAASFGRIISCLF